MVLGNKPPGIIPLKENTPKEYYFQLQFLESYGFFFYFIY